jgi:ketosteroid isomerase-like protein
MKQLIGFSVAVFSIAAIAHPPAQRSSALDSLVSAERAFAKTATEKGIRDSFLEYFAEDSIAFNPAPISATARLRSRPGRPFSEYELRWEPRTGDIAASGELGWLTGPSTFIDHTSSTPTPQHGNYLSVWRRQQSGPWRVFIDVGSEPPQAVTFAEGFTRFPLTSRYSGPDGKAAGAGTLLDADETLNARIARDGAPAAYSTVTTSSSRLHTIDRQRRHSYLVQRKRFLDVGVDGCCRLCQLGRSGLQLRDLQGEDSGGTKGRVRSRVAARCFREMAARCRRCPEVVTSAPPFQRLARCRTPEQRPGGSST